MDSKVAEELARVRHLARMASQATTPTSERRATYRGMSPAPSMMHLNIFEDVEQPPSEAAIARLTASEVIWKLAQGNRRYCEAKHSPHARPKTKLVDLLIEDPIRPRSVEALVFACAISFAPTDAVFDAEPGQIQVVRVCGNVCEKNDGVIGSLEFALAAEMPPVLLVMGNSMNELVDYAVIHAMQVA